LVYLELKYRLPRVIQGLLGPGKLAHLMSGFAKNVRALKFPFSVSEILKEQIK
jgi:hypothetical protein